MLGYRLRIIIEDQRKPAETSRYHRSIRGIHETRLNITSIKEKQGYQTKKNMPIILETSETKSLVEYNDID